MLKLKRFANWLLLTVVTAGLVVGCGFSMEHRLGDDSALESTAQSTSNCRIVAHDIGETEICGYPKKVVALSPHALDLLLSLDRQPTGYAAPLDVYQGEIFDDPAQQIPYLGGRITTQPVSLGKSGEPSLEKMVALKPDLILAQRANSYNLLAQIAPTLIWQDRVLQAQWQQHLRSLAIALGEDQKAEDVIQQYEARIAKARVEFADVVAAHPQLLLLAAHRLDEGIGIIGADTYLEELLSGVGFQLIPPPAATAKAPISIEALPELDDADTVIILGYNSDVSDGQLDNLDSSTDTSIEDALETHQVKMIKQDWEANAIAQSLTASQENRVYFATFYKWNALNGPAGAELILAELRQFFLER